jgi:hypothetical protein
MRTNEALTTTGALRCADVTTQQMRVLRQHMTAVDVERALKALADTSSQCRELADID